MPLFKVKFSDGYIGKKVSKDLHSLMENQRGGQLVMEEHTL